MISAWNEVIKTRGSEDTLKMRYNGIQRGLKRMAWTLLEKQSVIFHYDCSEEASCYWWFLLDMREGRRQPFSYVFGTAKSFTTIGLESMNTYRMLFHFSFFLWLLNLYIWVTYQRIIWTLRTGDVYTPYWPRVKRPSREDGSNQNHRQSRNGSRALSKRSIRWRTPPHLRSAERLWLSAQCGLSGRNMLSLVDQIFCTLLNTVASYQWWCTDSNVHLNRMIVIRLPSHPHPSSNVLCN